MKVIRNHVVPEEIIRLRRKTWEKIDREREERIRRKKMSDADGWISYG